MLLFCQGRDVIVFMLKYFAKKQQKEFLQICYFKNEILTCDHVCTVHRFPSRDAQANVSLARF